MDVDKKSAEPVSSRTGPQWKSPIVLSKDQKHRLHFGDYAIKYRPGAELHHPVKNGLPYDEDEVEHIWSHALQYSLKLDTTEHPLLVADRAFNSEERRQHLLEMSFERFQTPAMFLARSCVLAAFSVGKSTALVVDSGAGVTTTVPVHEGMMIGSGVLKTRMGGNLLDEYMYKIMFQRDGKFSDTTVRPLYSIKRDRVADQKQSVVDLELPGITNSFHRYHVLDVVRDIRETMCRVSDYAFDINANAQIPLKDYTLPDGKVLSIGAERFAAVEILFRPDKFEIRNDMDASTGFRFNGVSDMVYSSVDSCDVDLRRELYNNIVLTGGTCLTPGFVERLYADLNEVAPPALKPKVQQPNTRIEREYGVWIGGSILGSLGTFHQLWISKQEYEEHGASILLKKCP
jgi:actin-like protein 6A